MFRKPKPVKKGNLSQFGLLDIPDVDDGDDEPLDLSDDDMDLEAELAAISGGGGRRKPRKPAPVPAANLDAMIAESLKDIPSDEEVSGDDDDPDLLSELKELAINDEAPPAPPPRATRPAPAPPGAPSAENSTVSLLQDRISNYTLAERKAKENGESSRARRFARGLRTLNDLLKQAKAGKPVNDEDIPPPVPVGKPADAPAPPPVAEPPPEASLIDLGPHEDPPSLPEPKEPPPPPPAEPELSPERQQKLDGILRRQAEFKAAALHCKRSGDKTLALEYLKTVKQFDTLVTAFKTTEEGMDFDLADLPTLETVAAAVRTPKTEEVTQKAEEPAPADPAPLVTASSLDEALRQRLAYFQQQEVRAKEDGNSSKARRMGRIVKQYADAVRANAAGRTIATDDLPTPPGYAPLPTEGGEPAAPAAAPSPASPAAAPAPRAAPRASGAPGRYEKQLAFLLLRQKQFKEAALKAKREGDTQQALEYLKAAKGFDTVIEAAKGGLAVDLKSLPLPPKAKEDLEHTFDVVSAEDCGPSEEMPTVSAEDEDALSRLCNQLTSQLKLCLSNREHNRAIGNIAEANRFEHLATAVKQDLDVVAVAKSLGQSVPKFHYESRQFAVVKCNTDLNENDLELTIVRGIAYNVPNPKEVDTYVKFEFPYPQDAPVSDSTSVVKDTNSPEYNAVFPLAIHRGARACQRVFKRHAIKLNVYSRGGWFSRDSLLGAVSVKLAPLETHATLHDAYPLMDGRRPAGGSLEVKVRVRTPLLHQEVENTTHRWLVIDN
ncbi:coiled-coil and C2 domain-containing protein 1-like isoform X2 [Manduca sexta]|uniref:coiled-coil and C2 domain-containing protein 1-like isoform X2 n=1 Tax=Manduca sexta TaxID=7130 RepID=UPI00188EC1BD|nr:coiled-coil and C2 domain-containing protein 1-like isoform X2 [Manduca sexta]